MKLNYKRTILVGFAFFLISAFWQAYDATIPLILTNKFGMSQFWSGVVMAMDNILALFMLPLFGTLSDKTNTKYGKRTPYIVVGTLIASIAFVSLSLADSAQLKNLQDISAIDDPAALATIYDSQADATLMAPDGEYFVLQEVYSKEEFTAIRTDDRVEITGENGKTTEISPYANYVVPARQACAAAQTKANSTPLMVFVALLLVVLIGMATFRSPAVALMPDVTVKPLRSKANAIINLMGNAGGIIVLVLGMGFLFGISKDSNSMMGYTPYYAVIAGIMLVSLAIFCWKVKEKPWAEEMRADSARYGLEEEAPAEVPQKKSLSPAELRSLLLILASVALWYFGYNAVTSKYSVYAPNVLQKDYSTTMLMAQAAAIVSYLPAGMIASRIGRKKTILAGVSLLFTAFFFAGFMSATSPAWLMNLMFITAGIGWATINVNSFPMVVEMCSGSDIGRYTGFYYTASMAAQTVTPMVSGWFMDRVGMTSLFPYAAIFVALAFVTMSMVKHGDAKIIAKKGLEALDLDD